MGFSLLDTRTQREKFGLESKVLEAILLASMTDGLETQRQTHKKKSRWVRRRTKVEKASVDFLPPPKLEKFHDRLVEVSGNSTHSSRSSGNQYVNLKLFFFTYLLGS